jgi:hypothetical protein
LTDDRPPRCSRLHYVDAYEYAIAAGADTSALAESTRLALRDAGDRALALNAFGAAERQYAAALLTSGRTTTRNALRFSSTSGKPATRTWKAPTCLRMQSGCRPRRRP